MDLSRPANLSTNQKKVIQKLTRGRELANELRLMLRKSFQHDGSVRAEDLLMKILGSFSESLLIMSSGESSDDQISQISENSGLNSPCWDGRKSEDSGESSKTSALKHRRGCYKRRKTPATFTRVTPIFMDDGHAWRKYGQKAILNTTHPRNYYRCTHKYDQGCLATKQVQTTEHDPAMYRITYHGYHTCQNNLNKSPHQIMFDNNSTARDSSILLSFESNDPELIYNSILKHEKEEEEEEEEVEEEEYKNNDEEEYLPAPGGLELNHQNHGSISSSSSDHLMSHDDLTAFGSSGVYSGTASTHSDFELEDMMVGPFDIDDILQLDEF